MDGLPQVLLLGNGLNRAYDGGSLYKLLEDIHTNLKVELKMMKELPFPLQAVLATEDHVNTAVKEKQSSFCGAKNIENLRFPIQLLLDIPFDHIITTNYSYEIERVANSKVSRDGAYCKHLMRYTKGERAESKYLLHTYNQIEYQGQSHRIWHIHGEARKPNSVILGHYYYGELLARYQEELKKHGNLQYFLQQKGKHPIIESWLDAFIMGDVYVLGFGFDFSEIDLWWLLNRKKREKVALLEAYGGEFRNMGYWSKPADYKLFYNEAISNIRSCVEQKKIID